MGPPTRGNRTRKLPPVPAPLTQTVPFGAGGTMARPADDDPHVDLWLARLAAVGFGVAGAGATAPDSAPAAVRRWAAAVEGGGGPGDRAGPAAR